MSLLCVLVAAGCTRAPTLELTTWTLAGRVVTLPTHLDDGRVPDRPGHYRLTAHVELPPALRGRALQLVIPEEPAVITLRVDGAAAVDRAGAGTSGYRRRGPHEWAIPAAATDDGALDLELDVAHTWTQSAWWGTVPRLVPLEATDPNGRAVEVFNLLVSGAALVALLQIGVTSLMVYVIDRRRRPYLWFGVQALCAAFYPFFVCGWSQALFGIYDAPVLATMLVVATTASVEFTHGFFGLRPPWRGLWPLCGAVVLTTAIFHQPFVHTRAAEITAAWAAALQLYQMVVCWRLVARREGASRRLALYSLVSWVGLGLTTSPDIVYWFGLADLTGGVRLTGVGLALFGLFLSLLLSQQHITSLAHADELNAELAQRVAQLERRRGEIEQLNDELRRQVADRAAQIYAALALAASRSTTSAPELAVGELVQERYRVVRRLGAGGMGTVYEVARVADGRRLALKLARELDGESLARLAREAQMASTVAHPNVVGIVDVDVASSGFLYMVMELCEGQSLYELRPRFGDPSWAVPVLRQIASGLAALHRAGVVHRDLKPSNVLVTHEGNAEEVKISDFGIALNPEVELATPARSARAAGDPSPSVNVALAAQPIGPESSIWLRGSDVPTEVVALAPEVPDAGAQPSRAPVPGTAGSSFLTRTGFLPGTPAYIAPELVNGREMLTFAADMFAFGVIAHELIAGRRPFTEPPILALLEKREVPAPEPIATSWPGCPAELAEALDACLALRPMDRPSAAGLSGLLARAVATSGAPPQPPGTL